MSLAPSTGQGAAPRPARWPCSPRCSERLPRPALSSPTRTCTSPRRGRPRTTAGTTAIQVSAAVDPNWVRHHRWSFGLVIDGSSATAARCVARPTARRAAAQLLWEAPATPAARRASHSIQVVMVHAHVDAPMLSSPVSVTVMHATATPVISAPTGRTPSCSRATSWSRPTPASQPRATGTWRPTPSALYVDGTQGGQRGCAMARRQRRPVPGRVRLGRKRRPTQAPHALEVRLDHQVPAATWTSSRSHLHVTLVDPPPRRSPSHRPPAMPACEAP